MANHKGAVPEWLNSEYMEKVLKKSENSTDLQVLKVDITPGSAEGDNYACQIFRIAVTVKTNNQEKQLSLIGKYKVNTKIIDSVVTVSDVFAVEANFFNDMPPLFKKVLNKSDLDFLPKCHFIDLENNIILMEDLFTSNYKLQTRGIFLNKNQCTLVMQSLAELHGASYGALKMNPSLKDKYNKTIFDNKEDGPLLKFMNNSLKCARRYIKLYNLPQKFEDELLIKLKETLDVDWFKVCNLREDHLNFLLHGDCWMNNMMFHSNGDKVKLLDFQVYNYNCFANDLHYFFFMSASTNVIVNDIDFLLETYYEKLRSVAPDIPNLTLERVKKEFSDRYFLGYAITLAFRSAMTADAPPDLDKIMDDIEIPMGFDSEAFVKDLPILMEYFEKVGAFKCTLP